MSQRIRSTFKRPVPKESRRPETAVQLRYESTGGECLLELGAIMLAPAIDLDELGDQPPFANS